MTNSEINTKFLACVNSATKSKILMNIAKHYGISKQEAQYEVTSSEAEHLLDYVTGAERSVVHLMMKQCGLSS